MLGIQRSVLSSKSNEKRLLKINLVPKCVLGFIHWVCICLPSWADQTPNHITKHRFPLARNRPDLTEVEDPIHGLSVVKIVIRRSRFDTGSFQWDWIKWKIEIKGKEWEERGEENNNNKKGKEINNCSLQTWSAMFIRPLWDPCAAWNLHWKQNLMLSSPPVCQSWPWEREQCIGCISQGGIWIPNITVPHLPTYCTGIPARPRTDDRVTEQQGVTKGCEPLSVLLWDPESRVNLFGLHLHSSQFPSWLV